MFYYWLTKSSHSLSQQVRDENMKWRRHLFNKLNILPQMNHSGIQTWVLRGIKSYRSGTAGLTIWKPGQFWKPTAHDPFIAVNLGQRNIDNYGNCKGIKSSSKFIKMVWNLKHVTLTELSLLLYINTVLILSISSIDLMFNTTALWISSLE